MERLEGLWGLLGGQVHRIRVQWMKIMPARQIVCMVSM